MTTSSYTLPFRPRIGGLDILRIYNTKIENCTVVASQDYSKCTLTFLEQGRKGIVSDGVPTGLPEQLVGFCFLSRNNELQTTHSYRTRDLEDPAYVGWKLDVVRVSKNTFMIVFDPNPPNEEQLVMHARRAEVLARKEGRENPTYCRCGSH